MSGRKERKRNCNRKIWYGKRLLDKGVRKEEKRGETAKHMTKIKTEYGQLQN